MDTPFPYWGVTLPGIEQYISRFGTQRARGLSTGAFAHGVLIPDTAPEKLSFCEMYKHLPCVNTANVFVSHSWAHNFLDLLEALHEWIKSTRAPISSTFFWIDVFSNNQHIAKDLPFDWWTGVFQSSIVRIDRTVLVLEFSDPKPLKRSWCLWELYCSTACSSFDVTMSRPQKAEFMRQMGSSFEGVIQRLCSIDLSLSEASKDEDRLRIMQAVERGAGFSDVNKRAADLLRDWMAKTGMQLVQAHRGNEEVLVRGGLLQSLAHLMGPYSGRNEEAKGLYERAWRAATTTLGPRHRITISCMHRYGAFLTGYSAALAYSYTRNTAAANAKGGEGKGTPSAGGGGSGSPSGPPADDSDPLNRSHRYLQRAILLLGEALKCSRAILQARALAAEAASAVAPTAGDSAATRTSAAAASTAPTSVYDDLSCLRMSHDRISAMSVLLQVQEMVGQREGKGEKGGNDSTSGAAVGGTASARADLGGTTALPGIGGHSPSVAQGTTGSAGMTAPSAAPAEDSGADAVTPSAIVAAWAQVLDTRHRLQPRSVELCDTQVRYGGSLTVVGRINEAEDVLRQAIQGAEELQLSSKHPTLLNARTQLGSVLLMRAHKNLALLPVGGTGAQQAVAAGSGAATLSASNSAALSRASSSGIDGSSGGVGMDGLRAMLDELQLQRDELDVGGEAWSGVASRTASGGGTMTSPGKGSSTPIAPAPAVAVELASAVILDVSASDMRLGGAVGDAGRDSAAVEAAPLVLSVLPQGTPEKGEISGFQQGPAFTIASPSAAQSCGAAASTPTAVPLSWGGPMLRTSAVASSGGDTPLSPEGSTPLSAAGGGRPPCFPSSRADEGFRPTALQFQSGCWSGEPTGCSSPLATARQEAGHIAVQASSEAYHLLLAVLLAKRHAFGDSHASTRATARQLVKAGQMWKQAAGARKAAPLPTSPSVSSPAPSGDPVIPAVETALPGCTAISTAVTAGDHVPVPPSTEEHVAQPTSPAAAAQISPSSASPHHPAALMAVPSTTAASTSPMTNQEEEVAVASAALRKAEQLFKAVRAAAVAAQTGKGKKEAAPSRGSGSQLLSRAAVLQKQDDSYVVDDEPSPSPSLHPHIPRPPPYARGKRASISSSSDVLDPSSRYFSQASPASAVLLGAMDGFGTHSSPHYSSGERVQHQHQQHHTGPRVLSRSTDSPQQLPWKGLRPRFVLFGRELDESASSPPVSAGGGAAATPTDAASIWTAVRVFSSAESLLKHLCDAMGCPVQECDLPDLGEPFPSPLFLQRMRGLGYSVSGEQMQLFVAAVVSAAVLKRAAATGVVRLPFRTITDASRASDASSAMSSPMMTSPAGGYAAVSSTRNSHSSYAAAHLLELCVHFPVDVVPREEVPTSLPIDAELGGEREWERGKGAGLTSNSHDSSSVGHGASSSSSPWGAVDRLIAAMAALSPFDPASICTPVEQPKGKGKDKGK